MKIETKSNKINKY